MVENQEIGIERPFRLSTGGLFHKFMLQMGLVGASQYHPWRRILVYAGLTWLPLLILTAMDATMIGDKVSITFFRDPVPHVRFWIALPLLVFADLIIDPYMAAIVRHFQTSGLIPDEAKELYRQSLEKLVRQRDSAWVDVALFGLIVGLIWTLNFMFDRSSGRLESSSWMLAASGEGGKLTPAGWWLLLVSGPFIQFVLYRWIWRLIIWSGFMYRLSRISLVIHPAHPDRVGGLGILSGPQFSFGVIFAAIGAILSSTLASEIYHSERTLSGTQLEIVGFVLICCAIIIIPLCAFTRKLFEAKRRELRHYSTLANQLSEAFHNKWIENASAQNGKNLISAVDPSAVADYSVIFETISAMRLIPLNRQKVLGLGVVLVVPFVPLIFTQFSIMDALQQLAQMLV